MIRIDVHLDSAIHPSRDKHLARVLIGNVGGTDKRGNYACASLRGRGPYPDKPEPRHVQRRGKVLDYPRESKHVLCLVARALNDMGYK